ncbi:MAG: hypothetical protein DRJ44_04205 [Thermoprotei archaeon]|nr:MAG: hypothetical protein DRJ44_04205 [Thermoprotei archaeon]
MKFEILLTRKIKDRSILDNIDVIEFIQSYDFDWEFYLIISEKSNRVSLEKITPIPSSPGAVSIFYYVYSEEKLVKYLPYSQNVKQKIKELLEKGYEASKIIDQGVLSNVFEKYRDIIESCFIEVTLPIKSELLTSNIEKLIVESLFEEYEIVETEYFYLNPDAVKAILEESDYLHEYLEKLAVYYQKHRLEDKGWILLLRGFFPASATLLELEANVSKIIEKFGESLLDRVLLYNRIGVF